ncbi:hypothetical protein KIL84_007533 [Mauremys mutica]|uniref:Uncharacterized protein n=1 Tax=Mauremys mutica TaxID=74926 RepID=A0A9D4AX62_9SAUR|nr:hypothetical protein KIL84_007533 [Mauremys mutica]
MLQAPSKDPHQTVAVCKRGICFSLLPPDATRAVSRHMQNMQLRGAPNCPKFHGSLGSCMLHTWQHQLWQPALSPSRPPRGLLPRRVWGLVGQLSPPCLFVFAPALPLAHPYSTSSPTDGHSPED